MAKTSTKITARTRKPRNAKLAAKPAAKPETKQDIVLALLRRQSGASVAEIMEATDWQAHSVRGFFAGALKKRLGIEVVSEKDEGGARRYISRQLSRDPRQIHLHTRMLGRRQQAIYQQKAPAGARALFGAVSAC